jgi:hypothetical protein
MPTDAEFVSLKFCKRRPVFRRYGIAGDHNIVLGEVLFGEDIACSLLVFHRGLTEVFSAHLE